MLSTRTMSDLERYVFQRSTGLDASAPSAPLKVELGFLRVPIDALWICS